MASYQVQNIDLTPRRHHGYAVVLFIMGTLFPPLAVAARFGIGGDFWLNLLLTICGYIPGHGHNFYIQNIRNNKNHARTPKWAQRYGLVDTSEIQRKQRKSQWANRYNDRLPTSTLEGQAYAEGQEQGSSVDLSSDGHDGRQRQENGDLWRPEDEQYYRADNGSSSSGGRWHYPANFEDTTSPPTSKKSKKKKDAKKDRWARTEDAYSISEERQRKKSKKRKSKTASIATASVYSQDGSTTFPEDAEGGLYGDRQRQTPAENGNGHGHENGNPQRKATTDEELFGHEF
ncbi:hypothetical protein BDZ89DRAFT_976260 [Hymenopellis radicata]|nr:hypothetical protein BDZ89DRAFT_976260 [Hymenopellis radicata]